MNFQTMNKQRKMILIAAAVGIVSMFLPWVSVFGFSMNGMHGWGIVVFLCFLVAGILSVFGDQTKHLESSNWMLTLAAGALATLIMLVYLINAASGLGYLSLGFYGALLAAAGIVVLAYMHRSVDDNLQSGYDTLRSRFSDRNTEKTTDHSATKFVSPSNDSTKPVS